MKDEGRGMNLPIFTFHLSAFILLPSALILHPSLYALLTSSAIISNPRFTVASS